MGPTVAGGSPAMPTPKLQAHPPGQNRIGPRTATCVGTKMGSRVGSKPSMSIPHTVKL